MKKIILIVAVLVIALVGLTSYNGKEAKKESGSGDQLIASINTGGGIVAGGGKKQE